MIPIASETTLSIKKTAHLLQKLVDLEKTASFQLPEEIKYNVKELLNAQSNFVKQIDDYFNSWDAYKDSPQTFETAKAIVETCPEFLATRGAFGELPLHCATEVHTKPTKSFVSVFVQVGLQYAIGGEDGRGGLLVEDEYGRNVLQHLAYGDVETLQMLEAMDPPMFHASDISEYQLLHKAIRHSRKVSACPEMVKYLVSRSPSSLFDKTLSLACFLDHDKLTDYTQSLMKFLIHQAILYKRERFNVHGCIGGLFRFYQRENGKKEYILECLINKFGEEDMWNIVHASISAFDDIPILHKVIECIPSQFSNAYKMFPDSFLVRASNKRLPIHTALETGNMKWSEQLAALINTSRFSLKEEMDPVTKLPAFALAAMENSCDLRTIYYLLRNNPHHVTPCCTKSNKGQKRKKKAFTRGQKRRRYI